MAAYANVFLDNVVGVATADEGAEQVPAARGDVKESRLEGGLQVEARVEDVTDGCE